MANLTGYSSGYQQDSLLEQYRKSLAIKTELAQKFYDAGETTSKNKRLGITPISQTKSALEEVRDSSFQSKKALDNLKSVLKDTDAGVVLDRILAGNETVEFNRFFSPFSKEIAGQANITPDIFYQLWTKYKEKLAASGTTGIFIPSQKADIDALVAKVDTVIADLPEAKRIREMVEYLFESGMNKQIESIYKMLNTKKEYDRVVRETKLTKDELAREKAKWRSDVDGVMSGLIEAENEAKTAKEPNRFAVLTEFESVIDKIDETQKNIQRIDETISDVQSQYDYGYINDEQYKDQMDKLNNARENATKRERGLGQKQGRIENIKAGLDKAYLAREITEKQYYEEIAKLEGKAKKGPPITKTTEELVRELTNNSEAITTYSKEEIEALYNEGYISPEDYNDAMAYLAAKQNKPNKQKAIVGEFLSSSRAKKPSAEKLRRGEEFKQEMSQYGKEKAESEHVRKMKAEKEKKIGKQYDKLREEAELEQAYVESGAKAKKEYEKKQKKLQGYKAQSLAQIERIRNNRGISETTKQKFNRVIDEFNYYAAHPDELPLKSINVKQILQNSPITSRRASQQVVDDLDIQMEAWLNNLPPAESPIEEKKNADVVIDQTSDVVAQMLEENLLAISALTQTKLSETKEPEQEAAIIQEANQDSENAVSYFTALMLQVENQGKLKSATLTSESKQVFEGAVKAEQVEKLVNELRALDETELRKQAIALMEKHAPTNPTYNLSSRQHTLNATKNRKNKLIAYIVYVLTGTVIPKSKGGRVKYGRGIESAQKYINFGNYLIHQPNLEKGYLSIKYPSEAPVKEFSKILISGLFREMLNDILYENKFKEDDYMELDDAEKELFDRLITFIRLSNKEGLNLHKHKKITDKLRDKNIKRFNLLRGELIAGNDNPEVIKEIKVLLLNLYNNGIMNKKDYNKIIEEILVLS